MANQEPLIISDKDGMKKWSRSMRSQGKSIGLVPTMGFLHQGHLSLIQESHTHTQPTVVSIYVNPGQFSPNEDLSTYPSHFLGDIEKLKSVPGGVDVVLPRICTSMEKMMVLRTQMVRKREKMVSCVENSGIGHETWVRAENLEKGLCGKSRPIFFRGVVTVVTKLFNIVEPNVAVFGKKDYQQWKIIQRMVRDLDFGIKVVGSELMRDEDGLAMSSRNVHLSLAQSGEASFLICPVKPFKFSKCDRYLRRNNQIDKALSISKCLYKAKFAAEKGQVDCKELKDSLIHAIQEAGGKIDYAEIVDQESLEDLKVINRPAVCCVAAWFGNVRLIDNMEINV